MTTKEKAEAYDKALKQIKECTPDENGFITIYPQEIFSELAESEDEMVEKIRKELLSYLGNRQIKTLVESNAVEIWRTWLEKQGKKEYVLKSSKDEDVRKFMQKIEKLAKSYDIDLPNRSYDIYALQKIFLLGWKDKLKNPLFFNTKIKHVKKMTIL